MRNTLLLLLINVFQMFGNSGYSQNATLSLDLKDVTVKEVLSDIEEQSEFFFLYNSKLIDVNKKVSLNARDEKINKLLNELFRNTNIKYVIFNRQIILTPKEYLNGVKKELYQRQITGVVSNEDGQPLPGVTVLEKGTSNGTITNDKGEYSISVSTPDAVLVFTFVGMKAQEVPVGDKTTIDLTLNTEAIGLNEVVAIGYGTVKKSDLTGSVSSVNSEELNAFPSTNLNKVLQGRAAGVTITSVNGAPGDGVRIRIRGGTSINASNQPLYVVDGFAGAMLPQAEDVESVEVLKDASATAIYGSRGANGVILITTKRGTAGNLKIEANGSYSFQQIGKKIDLLNATQFGQYQNDYARAVGSASIPYPDPASLGEGTDWQDVIFRNGALQNYQIAVSGGNDKVIVYTSAKYYGQKGAIINSSYESFDARTNANVNFSDKLKLSTQMQFSHDNRSGVPTQYNRGIRFGAVSSALTFEPTLGIYDENGNYTLSTIGDVRNNPYAIIKGNTDKREGDGFIGNVNLDYEIVKHLKFHTSFGAQVNSSRIGYYSASTILGGSSVNGRASMSNSKAKNILSENYLTYDNTLGDIHHLTLMTGYSYQSARYESMSSSSQTFVTDAFGFWNLGAGATPLSPGSGLSEWAILSYYGRMNYNLKDRYLITLTGRYDGSSRFGANNKWAFFPSGAIAWNVKQEPFMQNLNTLSNLKLRASYGLTGNTEIGAYNSLARLSNILTVVGGQQVNAVVPSSVSNASLSWESTKQLDIGMDIGFFRRRVNLTADYYDKVTDNLLYDVPLPDYSGYSSTLKNWGKIGNKGVEFTLNTVNTTRALRWNTYFNIAFNKNEILDLPGGDVIWTQGFLVSSTNIRTVGSPIGVFYGYKFDGVYQEGDDFSAEPSKQPGDAKYMDINGRDAEGNLTGQPDGVVNSDDRTIIGNPNPDFTFGFTNSFDYKNFSLSIFFNGTVGNDIANYTRMELETMNGFNNSTTAYLDAWTPEHTNTDVPAVGSYSFEFSDRWIENGTFIRLKDITLGYNLPSNLTQKMSVADARLYISGQNILTFTKYSGYDPEVSWQDSNSQFGSDYGSYPNVKSFTLGMNITF